MDRVRHTKRDADREPEKEWKRKKTDREERKKTT